MARPTVFKDNPCEALGQIFSALSYIGDIRWRTHFSILVWHWLSTDIVVAYFYFANDHFYWGLITLLLVLIPGWIVAFFSIYWLIEDKRKPSPLVIFLHIICCGPLWRYWQAFNALRYQRPTFTGTFSEALSDVSMLRLIEGILESAPQVVVNSIFYLKNISAYAPNVHYYYKRCFKYFLGRFYLRNIFNDFDFMGNGVLCSSSQKIFSRNKRPNDQKGGFLLLSLGTNC